MPDALAPGRAVQAVFLEIRGELQRHVRRIVRCAATAEDLTQELFFRLDRIPSHLANDGERRRYLFRMAANIALDHKRVHANRVRLLDEMTPLLVQEHDEQPDADQRDQLELLQCILTTLPPRRSDIFRKSRLLGMTYNEIAAALSISSSLVEKEVAAAMKAILVAVNAPTAGVRAADNIVANRAQLH